MSSSFLIKFVVGSFPVGWSGDYNAFAQELVSLLEAILQGNIMPGLYSQGIVTLPSSDQGPVFMGGQIYLWDPTLPGYALYSPVTGLNVRSYNVLDNGDFRVWQRNGGGTGAQNVGPYQWWTGVTQWQVNQGGGFTVPAAGASVTITVVSSGGAAAGGSYYPGNNVITANGIELSITAIPSGTQLTLTNTKGVGSGNVPNNSLLTAYTTGYLTDRWLVYQDGSIATPPTQSLAAAGILGGTNNSNPNTSNCLRVTANATPVTPTSTQFLVIAQRLERQRAQALFDIKPSLSLWIRSSIAGTFCVFLQNAGPDRSLILPCAITAGPSWHQFPFPAITALPYGTGNWGSAPTDFCMTLGVCLMSGSSFQSPPADDNIWQTGNILSDSNQANLLGVGQATFDIALAQFEPNSSPTLFEYLPFAQQKARCERFYHQTPPYGTLLSAAVGVPAGAAFWAINGSDAMGTYKFPQEMRAPPTPWFYSPLSGSFNMAYQQLGAVEVRLDGGTLGLDSKGLLGITSDASFVNTDMYSVVMGFSADL